MRLLFVGDVVGRSGRSVLLAQLPRLRNSGRAISYVKFSKNPVQMSFRGPDRDEELVCDLLIAEPATHSPKDLGFSRAQ